MYRSKRHRVVESASCSKSVEAGCEYQDQIGKSECVSQVEMATSFSKFYPRVAHQRVSQLGRPSHDVSARATTSIPSFYATQCNIGQKKSGAKRLLELPDDYIHETAPLLPASQEFQAKQHRTARTGCESFVNRARLPRG